MAVIRQAVQGGYAGPQSVLASGTLTSSAIGFPIATLPNSLIVCVTWISIGVGGNPPSPGGGQPTIHGAYSGSFINTAPTPYWTTTGIGGVISEIFYIADAPVMSPSNTITTNVINSYGFSNTMSCEFVLYEVTGINHPEVYDLGLGVERDNHGVGTPVTHAFTATPNIDFILGVLAADGTSIAAGSGYTLGLGAQHTVIGIGQTEYWLAAPTGQTTVGFTGSETYWGIGAIAFKSTSVVPTITSVVLNSGPSGGGQLCTITGTNFNSDATVSFGGNAATDVVVVSSTEITCVTPVGFPGTVSVVVTEAAGTTTLVNGYTYTASKIPLSMNFQDAGGNPLSYGTVTFTLNTDAVTITGQQINAGRVVSFTLDVNGNLFGLLWPTDQMTADSISPNTTYRVMAYTSTGQLCFEQDMVIPT